MPFKDYLLYNDTSKEWRIANGVYEYDPEHGHLLKWGSIRAFSHFNIVRYVFNSVTFQPDKFFEVIKYYKD